jgi:hypothetical protein
MPFFEGLEEYKEMSYEYWRLNPEPAGMELDNVGTEWSDLISCLNSPSRFFVGERIIQTLEREAIPIFRKTLMPIARIRSKRLRELTPPLYYVVEANPGLSVDWSALGAPSGAGALARWTPTKGQPFLQFEDLSWTGLDLFSLTNYMATSTLYCTERIKRLAEAERWTNIGFVPIGVATGD